MTVRNLVLAIVGCAIALWMGAGRWAFGVGGELTLWYVPAITIPYVWLQLWMIRRLRIAADRGRPVGRAPFVTLALSWASAIGFGFTVPDVVDGELVTILSSFGGQFWFEMSTALSNPFGIIAFALMIASLAFAAAAGREPRPEEDDEYTGEMVPHPLDS